MDTKNIETEIHIYTLSHTGTDIQAHTYKDYSDNHRYIYTQREISQYTHRHSQMSARTDMQTQRQRHIYRDTEMYRYTQTH